VAEVPNIDVEAVVADVSADVERRRARGEYPDVLLRTLQSDFPIPNAEYDLEEVAILDVNRAPVSSRRAFGGIAVLLKRAVRRAIGWYVAPIAIDQSVYNLAVAGKLKRLEERIAHLERSRQRRAESPPPEAGPRR
jgi:hypothetical protein